MRTALRFQQVRISGGYVYDNTFLIEGHDVADIFGAPVAGVEVVTGPFIEDAIEETQVLTSAISAEHGRFGGGVVNMVTKSGGDDFGGTFRIDLLSGGRSGGLVFFRNARGG